MNEKLEKELREKYPKILDPLYEGRWVEGITVGDGWYHILDVLCYALQVRVDHHGADQVVAQQIKEKFGGLRFYYYGGDDACQCYVDFAEAMSYKTCEYCGNVGKSRGGGWIKTLCDECNDNKK